MTGRVVIVTGASSGLGYHVARSLCEGGNDVILATRNEDKANAAIAKIKLQNPNALATFIHLDLSSIESIRGFVDAFHATGKSLHVLINNAGIAMNFKDTKQHEYSKDNFEMTMATNHLGHFLLTNLLLNDLKITVSAGGEARIINVTSSLHDSKTARKLRHLQPLDVENLFLFNDGTYSGLQAYKNSKAANLLFTYELARRLEGSGVRVNAINPGFVPSTDLLRHASGAQRFLARYVMRFSKSTRTLHHATTAICSLATDEKFKETSGKYLQDGEEIVSSEETLKEDLQAKIWELSGRYTHLDGYEPLDVTPPPIVEPKKEAAKDEAKTEEHENGEDAKLIEDDHEKKEVPVNGVEEKEIVMNGKQDEENEKKDICKDEGKEIDTEFIKESEPIKENGHSEKFEIINSENVENGFSEKTAELIA